MPGAWLHILARFIFDESVRRPVVDQTIGDMRAEWIAAQSSAARWAARWRGYVAFWSLVLIAPVAFRNWPGRQESKRMFQWRSGMTLGRGISFVTVLVVLGLIAGNIASRVRAPLYTSTAVLQVVSARVPAAIIDSSKVTSPQSLAELRSPTAVVLSRTRLEKLIQEFNLYEVERKSMIVDEVIALMRSRLTVRPRDLTPLASTTLIEVAYTGSDPAIAKKVVDRVAAGLVEESLKDQQRRLDGTLAFLESEIEETRREMAALTDAAVRAHAKGEMSAARNMEIDVMQGMYKTLLTRRIEARMSINLHRRQVGEQLIILEAAVMSERPNGPTRLEYTLSGGGMGFATAVLVALVMAVRRLMRERRRDLATATT